MRRLVFVGAVAIAAIAATQALARTAGNGVVVSVPLPAVGQASVGTVAVTVTTKKPQVGALKVSTVSDKAFGNSSAVLIVESPKKATTHARFLVHLLVRRFPSPDRFTTTAASGLGLRIVYNGEGLGSEKITRYSLESCEFDARADALFEKADPVVQTVNGVEKTIQLVSARPVSVQDSPPEEVLDNVIQLAWTTNKCPGQPEGDDPGDK